MGDLLRELADQTDGGFIARVYGRRTDRRWEAWVEFTSLRTGELRRTAVLHLGPSRDEALRWAGTLGSEALRDALEDAEFGAVSELGTPPLPGGRSAPTS